MIGLSILGALIIIGGLVWIPTGTELLGDKYNLSNLNLFNKFFDKEEHETHEEIDTDNEKETIDSEEIADTEDDNDILEDKLPESIKEATSGTDITSNSDHTTHIEDENNTPNRDEVTRNAPVNSDIKLKYHIIGGCFRVESNAENFLNNLIKLGYKAVIVDKKGDLYRVSYGGNNNLDDIRVMLKEIQSTTNPSAWITRIK